MPQDTANRLEAIVQPFACQKKPMFGYEVNRVNGNMSAGKTAKKKISRVTW